MMDVVIALLPLYFMAFYFYGLRALMLGLASVAAAVVSDFVCILLEGQNNKGSQFPEIPGKKEIQTFIIHSIRGSEFRFTVVVYQTKEKIK